MARGGPRCDGALSNGSGRTTLVCQDGLHGGPTKAARLRPPVGVSEVAEEKWPWGQALSFGSLRPALGAGAANRVGGPGELLPQNGRIGHAGVSASAMAVSKQHGYPGGE